MFTRDRSPFTVPRVAGSRSERAAFRSGRAARIRPVYWLRLSPALRTASSFARAGS